MKYIIILSLMLIVVSCGRFTLNEDSPYNAKEIGILISQGKITKGMRDLYRETGVLVKEIDYFEFKEKYPKSQCNMGSTNDIFNCLNLRYLYTYTRYIDKSNNYSFYKKDGMLFAVYIWNIRTKTGKYYFNDDSRMSEYIRELKIAIQSGNIPNTYAVPEEMRK